MNFSLLANSLLFLGIMVLLVSLGRVWSLVKALPQGKMQLRWYVLGVMICLFIFGYLGQIILFWNSYTELSLLIVPVIFFCGSLFVWTVCVISLQTTLDLKVVLRENVTDSLTKIYNRLYFDERLVEEVDRADRYHIPLSILMFDIDHFKSVNDNWGHQAGDKILVEFGELVKSLTRASDIVARYGGEEFLVLSPSTDAQGAQELAERIRSKTQSHKFAVNVENGESSDVEVTVSAGVAQYSRDSEYSQPAADGGKLVKLADEALYLAKNQGRNRVVSSKESSKVSSKETSKESCKDSAIEHDFLQELGSNSPLPETATPQFAMANASRS